MTKNLLVLVFEIAGIPGFAESVDYTYFLNARLIVCRNGTVIVVGRNFCDLVNYVDAVHAARNH